MKVHGDGIKEQLSVDHIRQLIWKRGGPMGIGQFLVQWIE
jgi:hypothetical protein